MFSLADHRYLWKNVIQQQLPLLAERRTDNQLSITDHQHFLFCVYNWSGRTVDHTFQGYDT